MHSLNQQTQQKPEDASVQSRLTASKRFLIACTLSLLFFSSLLASLNWLWSLVQRFHCHHSAMFRAGENTGNSEKTDCQGDFLSLHKCKFSALTSRYLDQEESGTASQQQSICTRLLSFLSGRLLIACLLFRPQHIDIRISPKRRMSQILKISASGMFQWEARSVTREPHKQIERGAEMDLSTLHSAYLHLMILYFISRAKDNTITRCSELERDILRQIPDLLGGRVIELQLHMKHKLWDWWHLFPFAPTPPPPPPFAID